MFCHMITQSFGGGGGGGGEALTNRVDLKLSMDKELTFIKKCGMKLLIHGWRFAVNKKLLPTFWACDWLSI